MGAKVEFIFNPLELIDFDLQPGKTGEALDEVADYVKEQVLSYVGEARSPVEGWGTFEKLSKDYAKQKKKISSKVIPNLELSGEMLDNFDVVRSKGKNISVRVSGSQSAVDKAQGHNQHEKSWAPQKGFPIRRFIPAPDEELDGKIIKGIKRILADYAREEDSNG